jgi:hypothetical protein
LARRRQLLQALLLRLQEDRGCFLAALVHDDDRPFIVLTETKSSYRHIPVWARCSPQSSAGLSSGGFGASSAAPPSAPAVSGSFDFVAQDAGLDEKESDGDIVIQVLELTRDAEREKDILIRVSASSTWLQVRAGVLSELKRRGVRKKLQHLFYLCRQEGGKDLKDDDVVGAVQLNAYRPWGYAHTVVYMCLAKDTGKEAVILAGIKAAFHAEQEKQLRAPALVA